MPLRLRTAIPIAVAFGIFGAGHALAHPHDPADCPGYGPMWQQLTPEQRQQMWEQMQRWRSQGGEAPATPATPPPEQAPAK